MLDNWADIHSNFKTFLETTLGGYHESDGINITRKDNIPTSIFDKSYSLVSLSMPTPWRYINGEVHMIYNVRLIVCFEINLQDSKASYNAAVSSDETILKSRLPDSTWSGSIVQIEHKNTGQLLPVSSKSTESFCYVTVDFQVVAFDTLQS